MVHIIQLQIAGDCDVIQYLLFMSVVGVNKMLLVVGIKTFQYHPS